MRAEFEKFNAEHVGEDSVFPTKNGAPKILEQFKDKPYTLELRDEFTTVRTLAGTTGYYVVPV
jgi:hypothetical protein